VLTELQDTPVNAGRIQSMLREIVRQALVSMTARQESDAPTPTSADHLKNIGAEDEHIGPHSKQGIGRLHHLWSAKLASKAGWKSTISLHPQRGTPSTFTVRGWGDYRDPRQEPCRLQVIS